MTNVNYNDGKWYKWNGGECPVHPDSEVQVRLIDPEEEYGDMVERACNWVWDCVGCAQIIAFRVIKEHKEPREFWIIPKSGRCFSKKPTYEHAIHVREVLDNE